MSFLSKLEDLLVHLIRLVLLAFAIAVLIALVMMLVDKMTPDAPPASAQSNVQWSTLQPDLLLVVQETGRDLGVQMTSEQLQARLGDAQLRSAYQKVDQLLRSFVAQEAAQHARIEQEHQSRGLAPLHPLLVGDALPTPQAVAAYEQAQARATEAGEDPDAAARAQDESEECCWSDPVDVAARLHDSATQMQSEHGEAAYAAFVLGAPAAFERVLGDATLQPRLHQLQIEQLVQMLLTNYSISFGQAVLEQDSDSASSDSGAWDAMFSSIELTLWSVVLSFLVMVVFLVTVIRMEKHLRALSQQAQRRP